MPRTARDLIKDAGVTAGIVAPSESFTGAEVVDALRQLNNILEQLNLDKNFPPHKFINRLSVTGSAITIGKDPSADIQIRKPNIITSVAYVLGGVENPLRAIPEDDFDNASKTDFNAGYPNCYVVRNTYPIMSIDLYPLSSGSLDVVVTGEVSIGDWDLDTQIQLPDGYAPYLEYKLAEILALREGNEIYPSLKAQAQDFLDRVKRINNTSRLVSKKGSLTSKGRYNIYDDTIGGI